MSSAVFPKLSQVLRKIDRPGSFCASGGVPVVLPGLEVDGLGPVGLPLTAKQAEELKQHCEQAPYGKGEQTLVDTNVRRVWRMTPDRFALTNPEWEPFLKQIVGKVQEELGLEKRKLESHLYDLLLYEPGSFFLPHRDGEKLERMVATLVLMLPSSFQGGELVVRHDGQERVIDCSGDPNPFRIHFAAFYADCEHEVRPLREGYRLCLVYNLTLKKGKKGLAAPRSSEHLQAVTQLLRDWTKDDTARRMVVTLDHQYTQDGLTWDALKGVDRVKAQVLREAARQAECQAYLALLTFHESGSAQEPGGYYGRRRRWHGDDDEEGEDRGQGRYVMDEVFETSLTADRWIDPEGQRLSLGKITIEEDELLEPDSLQDVVPEEEYEGYTGNEGMTLDRWYRHGAIVLWPNKKHFDILCDAGSHHAVPALALLVKQWQHSSKKEAAALRADCLTFAATILARWRENPYSHGVMEPAESGTLLESLAALGEPGLVKSYLAEVMTKDVTVDPGKLLPKVCETFGWGTLQPELEVVFSRTTAPTLERNVRLLEHICLAKPRDKEEWSALCQTLAQAAVAALEAVDQERAPSAFDYRVRQVDRAVVLAGLARSLLVTGQSEQLSRVVTHALAHPKKYPLTTAHMAALAALQPWLTKHVKEPDAALTHWLTACREQLESLTAKTPQPPPDFRREVAISCKCSDCDELRQFLRDPQEQVHRFRMAESRRKHLEQNIRHHHCDLDLKTERTGSPHTLVCTKNTASYQAKLAKFHQDQEHLAMVRSIEASLAE